MTENPKWVAIFHSYKQLAPILTEICKLENFRRICENYPTDWGHLVEVETGEILDTYIK